MHAHIRTYQIQPGAIEERLRHYRDVAAPTTRQRPGHGGVIILIDRATHKNLTIGLWDGEEEMRAAEQDPAFKTPLSHARYAVGDVTTEYFEVAHNELPPEPGVEGARIARLTRFTVQPGRFDERLRFSREQTFPAVRQLPGNQGGLLLADATTAQTISISLWRSAADLEAATTIAGYEALRGSKRFAAGPVIQEQLAVAHIELF
jgi:heme-degrading monooxygenase HmoA